MDINALLKWLFRLRSFTSQHIEIVPRRPQENVISWTRFDRLHWETVHKQLLVFLLISLEMFFASARVLEVTAAHSRSHHEMSTFQEITQQRLHSQKIQARNGPYSRQWRQGEHWDIFSAERATGVCTAKLRNSSSLVTPQDISGSSSAPELPSSRKMRGKRWLLCARASLNSCIAVNTNDRRKCSSSCIVQYHES